VTCLGLGGAATGQTGAQRAVALATVLADRTAAGAALQHGAAVARATTAAGHQDAVGAAEGADPHVRAAAARTAAAMRTATAAPVADAAGTSELTMRGRTGDAGGAGGELEGLPRGHRQGGAGLAAETAGRAGDRRVRGDVARRAAALGAEQVDVDRAHAVRDG